jgi:hypothetical protein
MLQRQLHLAVQDDNIWVIREHWLRHLARAKDEGCHCSQQWSRCTPELAMLHRAECHDLAVMVNQVVRLSELWISRQGNLLKNNMVHTVSIPLIWPSSYQFGWSNGGKGV